MIIKTIDDIQKYTKNIKFPIILYIQSKTFKVETEQKLIALIIRLYQRNYPIETLIYEEIEYIEFEEI